MEFNNIVEFVKWLAENSPDNLYGEIDYIQTTAKELLESGKTEDQWKKFVEWIGSHGLYWFFDEEKKHWIGTPHELPSTERLWEIWEKNIYTSLNS